MLRRSKEKNPSIRRDRYELSYCSFGSTGYAEGFPSADTVRRLRFRQAAQGPLCLRRERLLEAELNLARWVPKNGTSKIQLRHGRIAYD